MPIRSGIARDENRERLGETMQIKPLAQPDKQKLSNDKAEVATDKSSETVAKPATEKTEHFSAENNRLLIGAKSLMTALNKELRLGGTFEFQATLNESLNISAESGSILDKIDVEPINFDFEEVAKNVLEFVGKTIMGAKEGGANDAELEKLFAQAREGVEMGFEQARQELGDMDLLNDDVEKGMDKSYGLIQQGITDLESNVFKENVASQNQDLNKVTTRELGMQETEKGSIAITTLDGDDINISFGSQTTLAQTQSATDTGYSSQTSYSRSQSFTLEVNGELDDDELKAINSLVENISGLADEFFNGDVQKAFEQASELGFDASQIAQYSLDFTEVKQVAVREHYSPQQSPSPIATLSPYVKSLDNVMESADPLFSKDNLKQLMQDIAQQQLNNVSDLLSKSAIDFTNFNEQLSPSKTK